MIRAPDGDVPVPVRLRAPEYADGNWICRYTIGWPEQPRDKFRSRRGRAAGAPSGDAEDRSRSVRQRGQ
ncbi:DUF6968 family protein [Methylobacterium oryzae]|uniref:DUF6968 family protein n=1 Tax=Methylobacterium TaxID=407 RepID=UPI003AF222CE